MVRPQMQILDIAGALRIFPYPVQIVASISMCAVSKSKSYRALHDAAAAARFLLLDTRVNDYMYKNKNKNKTRRQLQHCTCCTNCSVLWIFL